MKWRSYGGLPLTAEVCQDGQGVKRIFYGEFDGRRRKRVLIKLIGG